MKRILIFVFIFHALNVIANSNDDQNKFLEDTFKVAEKLEEKRESEILKKAALDRGIDYAAEEAARDIIKKFSDRQIAVGNIAFLPLFNDNQNIYTVVRNELSSIDSDYKFFMRKSDDLNKLINEIRFGDLRSDIMNQSTIQKFGSIEGVNALLYGEVREAGRVSKDEYIVRLSLVLADVETGMQIASANVKGIYKDQYAHKNIEKKETGFGEKAGKVLQDNIIEALDSSPSFFAKNTKNILIGIIIIVGIIVIYSLLKNIINQSSKPR